jgi:hypothetical protein
MNACIACNGSGQASNGRGCFPCGGTGQAQPLELALRPDLTPHKLAAGDINADLLLAQRCVQFFEQLPCQTQQQYEEIGALIKQARSFAESYEERRTRITKPLNDAKREVDSWLSPIVKAYEKAVEIGKNKLIKFTSDQNAERARIAQEAAQQHAQGNIPGVLALAHQAQQTLTPRVEGIKTRKVKAWRVVDIEKVPREFLVLNTVAISEAMRKGEVIAGIEYYEHEQIAVTK